MKQLFIYTGKNKRFDKETEISVQIQIDNSLDLGWNKEDILLVTDFLYSYKGITSEVVPDKNYYGFDNSSNKIPAILYLIDSDFLVENELYWYHDFDVYQNIRFDESDLALDAFDMGITPYGYKPQWNLGSIFFRTEARDIFGLIEHTILHKRKSDNRCDEKALQRLIVQKKIDPKRYKELDLSYNFTKRCIASNYAKAQKPLKAVHFHLWDKDALMSDTALNLFMNAKNSLKIPLMDERLVKIFHNHDIK